MGYDTPRSLGDRETGGGLSLPVWITSWNRAQGRARDGAAAPEGVVNVGGEWYYEEYARGGGVGSLGWRAAASPPARRLGEQRPGVPSDRSLMNSDGLPPPRRPRPPTSAAASWTCSGTEVERLAGLLAGVAAQVGEELALPLVSRQLRPSNL
jgi:penicillin-binding protein 1A